MTQHARDPLQRFSPWFYAAAGYNLVWGTAFILAPGPGAGREGQRYGRDSSGRSGLVASVSQGPLL